MQVRSLGYRTDLFFPQFDGVVEDRGNYVVVRTPSNPTFYWGNFLLFAAPPRAGDLPHWKEIFSLEIGPPTQVKHLAFGWDSTDGETGDIDPFLGDGFSRDDSVVLTAQKVHSPPQPNREASLRPLAEDWEWEQALAGQITAREPQFSLEGYTVYMGRKMASYRAMTEAGLGAWFGAFLGDRLVASLGLFVFEGIGRFQSVSTHPDFRRRGLCGTLVHHAASYGIEHMGVRRLVMVADAHYHAARIYESVGFVPTERHVTVTRW